MLRTVVLSPLPASLSPAALVLPAHRPLSYGRVCLLYRLDQFLRFAHYVIMTFCNGRYPKFLAFLQLAYPNLFDRLTQFSKKSDLVQANIISAHSIDNFSVIIFSDKTSLEGDRFNIISVNNDSAPYDWDWRWVFAIKLMYKMELVFTLKFKRKVIALPSGKHTLSPSFFENLQMEFSDQVQELISYMNNKQISIASCYSEYLIDKNS